MRINRGTRLVMAGWIVSGMLSACAEVPQSNRNRDVGLERVGPSPPSPPEALSARPFNHCCISLLWNDRATSEIGFEIERKDGEGEFIRIGHVDRNVTVFLDTGLAAETTYAYRVRASGLAGASGYTRVARATTDAAPIPRPKSTVIPQAPTHLMVMTVSSSELYLDWMDGSHNEEGFRIERRSGEGDYATVASVGEDVTSYTDCRLAPATTYSYRVCAVIQDRTSAFTEERTASTHPSGAR